MTSIFPYLPELIESFGVRRKEVAKWAGITSAVFSFAQCLTAIMWGRASDKFGRKPTILFGLTFTMITSILWGMSSSLPMAITIRAIAGACNGNVGIIRTMVAELVPEKELQPRAFSIMPLVWGLGSIFGPAFGGFLAKPAQNMPDLFGNNRLFIRFPFLLPNLVAASLFLIGITTGILFLKETLETKRHRTDYGRVLGGRLVAFVKLMFNTDKLKGGSDSQSNESTTLLRPEASTNSSYSAIKKDDESTKRQSPDPPLSRPTLIEVFTRQSVINLMAYTFLALHAVAYDQLLPIFLHNPRQIHTPANTSLPFKFSGGYGLGSSSIGTIYTMYGICGCVIQFLIFPPVARKFGVLNCLKACGIVFPLICFVTPYTALIDDPVKQKTALLIIMVVRSCAIIFAFPCSLILLTNSAASLRVLGTLNGFAVSISAVGRAAGPAMGGAAFTWGLETGYIITAYFLLGSIAVIGAIPIWYLVEMEGFSKTGDESDEEDEDEDGFPGNNHISGGPSSHRRHSTTIKSESGDDEIARMESKMSSPIGISGGSVGPGGPQNLSNGLAASNMGQGTGGTSFT